MPTYRQVKEKCSDSIKNIYSDLGLKWMREGSFI